LLVQVVGVLQSELARLEEIKGEFTDGSVPRTHRGGDRLDAVSSVRQVTISGGREEDALSCDA
jgi:hypothetical protein